MAKSALRELRKENFIDMTGKQDAVLDYSDEVTYGAVTVSHKSIYDTVSHLLLVRFNPRDKVVLRGLFVAQCFKNSVDLHFVF